MTQRHPADIEEAIQEALKVVNYQYGISYKVMAELSKGFKESTLKGFANGDCRLKDERETLFYFIKLAQELSDRHNCDVLTSLVIPGWKTLQAVEPCEVDGDLRKELLEWMEEGGEMSRASKCKNLKKLKEIRIQAGKTLSQIDAEIAFMEAKQ